MHTSVLNAFAVLALASTTFHVYGIGDGALKKGYDVRQTGLTPVYPTGYRCSPLTSLYASWLDVDGTHRDEIHTGVDGGRLGEWILAPGPGTVKEIWEANWQWGNEGALLIEHSAAELNMPDGPPLYFTAYDHLKLDELARLKVGQKVRRGQKLARVYRPGGRTEFLPEVHWEVWEVQTGNLEWKTNRFGGREWRSKGARLIDPLYMLGANSPPADGVSVAIVPFVDGRNYSAFRGFTYIFNCERK